ncbi:glycosyltransferase family 2 protein [Formosa sediminum]|uniref:Glycosyltransferase family 2 protein n=1 Tax=Formosa sediminum TaxID=2594004 RepID=A0A516GRE5_9FLAO|nr:glycosyltransferase family 2 protein [Formosa sediminum]QDO94079.1 glycosyltransferase family 2 protein [Formosa sediminum]
MKLSVIVLNYNVRYFLELCLKSVEAAISDIDAEIIVVDNNSADDSCKMVRERFPKVKLIENKTNFGFSKGNNIGVAQAKGEYICILNPDTVVAEDTLTKVLNFADQQSNLGIVGCKLIDGAGNFLPESKRNVPTPEVALKKILGDTTTYYANHLKPDSIGVTNVLVGAFMVLKRAVYHAVNGFDEDYFMYGEDVDLSYKILNKGYTNHYYGHTTVIHFKGECTFRNRVYAKNFNGSMQIFYKKHFKKSMVFEALIWGGIKGLTFLNLQPSVKKIDVKSIVFLSNNKNTLLESALDKKIVTKRKIESVSAHQQIIFDNNLLSFKEIIAIMESFQDCNTVTYRIIPRASNFVIGSDNKVSRGNVIHF